jgi:hypothetical protein
MLTKLRRILEMIRFSHTLFALAVRAWRRAWRGGRIIENIAVSLARPARDSVVHGFRPLDGDGL